MNEQSKHSVSNIEANAKPFREWTEDEWNAQKELWREEITRVFSNETSAKAFRQKVDDLSKAQKEKVEAEIARRPVGLRLPHRGFQFRTLRNVSVDIVVSLRINGTVTPFEVKPFVVSEGELFQLDYEPPHATTTHCSLVPKRYDELEMSLVDPRTREIDGYSGYSIYISYIQLDKDFEWFGDAQ
jgi:hypothetical protein